MIDKSKILKNAPFYEYFQGLFNYAFFVAFLAVFFFRVMGFFGVSEFPLPHSSAGPSYGSQFGGYVSDPKSLYFPQIFKTKNAMWRAGEPPNSTQSLLPTPIAFLVCYSGRIFRVA